MGPLDAIKTGFASSFQSSSRDFSALALGVVLFGSSPEALLADTSAYVQPLETAQKLCLDVPDNRVELEKATADAGWSIDAEAPMNIMLSVQIIEHWDPDDLVTTLQEGVFMAASILSNSAMKGDQPGFTYRDASFAVFNIERVEDAEPYCIISGPYEIEPFLVSMFELSAETTLVGQRRAKTSVDGQSIQLIVKDPLEADTIVAAFPAENAEEVRAEWIHRFKPVNLVVTQMLQEEQ